MQNDPIYWKEQLSENIGVRIRNEIPSVVPDAARKLQLKYSSVYAHSDNFIYDTRLFLTGWITGEENVHDVLESLYTEYPDMQNFRRIENEVLVAFMEGFNNGLYAGIGEVVGESLAGAIKGASKATTVKGTVKGVPQKALDVVDDIKLNNGAPPKGYKGGRTFTKVE